MPLPGDEGEVAGIAENLRKRDDSLVQISLVPWLASRRRWTLFETFRIRTDRSGQPFYQRSETCDMVVGAR